MSKLNSKLMKAQAITATGKVVIPGLTEAQIVYVLHSLRSAELDVVYSQTVVEWFNQPGGSKFATAS